MATIKLDTLGMKCPQPVLKVAAKIPELNAGDILEVHGDCSTFEDDMRKWCDRMKRTLLAVNVNGTAKIIQIQF